MAVTIQLRRDTAANWTAANSLLAIGEPGFETDSGKLKIGDGATRWTSLAYFSSGSSGAASPRATVSAATTGAETYTISGGSVTQISGTTIDGVSPAVNDRILVKDAPATSGAGSVNSLQPGNGIYTVTSNTTNLSLSRASDMSGSTVPGGAFVFVAAGTANASGGFVVSSPANLDTAFTYGTTNLQWTQFSGAGQITAGTGLSKTGNTLSLLNPVTIALGGTGAATQQAAINALTGAQSAGKYLRSDGTNAALAALAAADLTGTIGIGNGGTGAATAAAAFNALSPMTTLGDIVYGGTAGAGTRLAGTTGATKQFLTQTGTGTASAAPSWGGIAAADVPVLNQNTTGTASNVTGTVALANGGTGATTAAGAVSNLGLGLAPSGDTTGATDKANINAVIAAGGPLYLVAGGTYYINGALTALPSNFLFAGGHGGRGTTASPTVIKCVAGYSGTTAPINFVSGSSEQEIRDVSFDGSAMTAGTCACIEANTASPVSYVKLRRLLITGIGFSNGIHLLNVGGNLLGWTGEQVTVRSTNATGILLVGATDGDWFLVQSGNCGTHGWSINGCPNSRFTACKANQNAQNGFDISGTAWGTGAGSGGAVFWITTDRNTQSGVNVSATGTGPMLFLGLYCRRDGSDGNTGRAGLLISAGATNPVVVAGITVFPGVNDDGTGNNGPANGVSVSSTSAPVRISTGYIQGATTAVANGGANPNLFVDPGVTLATGTTSAPVTSTSPLGIGNGGTGAATAAAAFNALSPMTTLGDIEYESGANTAARLAGNTTATKKFLTQTGTGTASAAPGWNTLVSSDLPAATTAAQGAVVLPAASARFNPANPTGTASTTAVMMGLGSTVTYTPSGSGKVIVTLTAVVAISAGAAGAVTIGGRYGTGAAPANAAAASGTVFGASTDPVVRVANVAATSGTPVTITDRLSLTAGTTYWFDLAVTSPVGTTTCGPITIVAVLAEQLS